MTMHRVEDTAGTARETAGTAVASAGQGAREVVDETGAHARELASEAAQHAREVSAQVGEQVREQLRDRTAQGAGQLRAVVDQLGALRDGRPEEAGPLLQYVDDARRRIAQYASRLEQGGPDAVTADLRRFARRRPGMFLLGAGLAGFVAGRVARSGALSASGDDSTESRTQPAASVWQDGIGASGTSSLGIGTQA